MIGRTELALRYSPDDTEHTAWQKLKYWIDFNPELSRKIREAGYGRKRYFTPAQVKLIYDYLGEP